MPLVTRGRGRKDDEDDEEEATRRRRRTKNSGRKMRRRGPGRRGYTTLSTCATTAFVHNRSAASACVNILRGGGV
jgi:hypothetical protein